MTPTLVVVVLFVGAMALLPWMVRRLQQRHAAAGMAAGGTSRVLSAVAIGPHQRVVTVEVGPAHARTWLILGVTAQQVTCLHVLAASSQGPGGAQATDPPSFAREIAEAAPASGKPDHG